MRQFILHIKKGEPVNPIVFNKSYQGLEDGTYTYTINNSRKRSLPQNAFYWSICVPLIKEQLNHAGYNEINSNEKAHEIIKYYLLKKILHNSDGTVLEYTGSTTELTTTEFNDFIERLQQWAAETFGLVLPNPNEQSQLIFNN